jgi:hypothetical protein
MRNWLMILLVVLVALVGYRLGAHPVRAESSTPAFSYGQTVLLFWENGRQQQRCAVHRQAGDFVKCGDEPSADGGRSGTVWYNLRFIERVEEVPRGR